VGALPALARIDLRARLTPPLPDRALPRKTAPRAMWRNGRRWGLKIPCPLRACGFDSHHGQSRARTSDEIALNLVKGSAAQCRLRPLDDPGVKCSNRRVCGRAPLAPERD